MYADSEQVRAADCHDNWVGCSYEVTKIYIYKDITIVAPLHKITIWMMTLFQLEIGNGRGLRSLSLSREFKAIFGV